MTDSDRGFPNDFDFKAAVTDLVNKVNGFVYAGSRLDAVVKTVRVLRENPDLAERILKEYT